MGCGGGDLGAPPLGCSALGAEQEQIEWNGMSSDDRSSSSSYVRPYPLYNKIGRVHGGLGELVYGLHALESRRALQRCAMDRGNVVELKKPSASFGCSVLTLCVSGYVGLDRPSPGGPSRVFLMAKKVGSRG